MKRDTRKNSRNRGAGSKQCELLWCASFQMVDAQCSQLHPQLKPSDALKLLRMELNLHAMSLRAFENLCGFFDMPRFLFDKNINRRSQLSPCYLRNQILARIHDVLRSLRNIRRRDMDE